MKKLIIITIVILLVLGLAGGGIYWYVRQNTGEQVLKKAMLALRAKNYKKAAEMAGRYVIQEPKDWRGHNIFGEACLRLGRYDEARTAFHEASRLEPSEVGPILGLASAYAFPAKRELNRQDTSSPVESLRDAIGRYVQANDIVLKAKATDAKSKLDLSERLGRDHRSISMAWRAVADRLAKEADRAEKVRSTFMAGKRRDASAEAMGEADKAAGLAIETLLGVVVADPSRPRAAQMLVDMCIECIVRFKKWRIPRLEQRIVRFKEGIRKRDPKLPADAREQLAKDRKFLAETKKFRAEAVRSLEEATKKIMALDNPPALAVLSLALHDLRSSDAGDEETSDKDALHKRLRKHCKTLDDLLKSHPDELRIKLARARAAYALGDRATAKRIVMEVLADNPHQRWARYIRAGLRMAERKFVEAERQLFALKMDNPGWADAHYAFGMAADANGRKQVAMRAMRTAAETAEKEDGRPHPGALRYLAQVLSQQGFSEAAFAEASAYYKARPWDPEAVRLFVKTATELDRPQLKSARRAIWRVLNEPKPKLTKRPEMMYAIGESFDRLGEETNARVAYLEAADKAKCPPKSRAGRMARARALRKLGRTSEAEMIFTRELAGDADQPHVHFELSRLYSATDRPFQAIDHLRDAVRLNERETGYGLALAQLWFDAGDIAQCEEALAKLEADNADANLLRLRIKLVRGKRVVAEEEIEQINRTKHAGLALAMTYLNTGRPRQCANVCEQALRSAPQEASLLFLYGRACLIMRQKDKCIEQWSRALQAAPRQLARYLSLAGLMATDLDLPKVTDALGGIPGSQGDMIALTVGWLQARRRDFAGAAKTYGRLADNTKMPKLSRQSARLLCARSLASAGQVDKALAGLDTLARDKRWQMAVLQARADILTEAGREDQAVAALVKMGRTAVGTENAGTLRSIAGQMMRLGRFTEALDLCDKVRAVLPQDARTYLLREVVLRAAGRMAETPPLLEKAIECQPANLKLYVRLATIFDSLEQPDKALEAVKRMEGIGRAGKARALFERGRFLARWGLIAQAEKCFLQLETEGYSENPGVQLSLGKVLARVGSIDRARKMLAKVTEYCDQYIPAQVALAELADEDEDRLRILAELAEAKPDSAVVLQRWMHALILAGKGPEARKAFKEFVEETGRDRSMPAGANWLAVQAMVHTDDETAATAATAAARFVRERAEESRSRQWRHIGILLSVDNPPDKTKDDAKDAKDAKAMLPEPAAADIYDALLGVIVAAKGNDAAAAAEWARRVDEISRDAAKRKPPATVPPRYRVLAALAGGRKRDEAKLAGWARSANVGPAAALELLGGGAGAGAAGEAAALLKATLAVDWGLDRLARAWAMDVLQARPTCQWAATLIMRARPDAATHKKVVALLRPSDSALALRILGSLRRDEGSFKEAAGLYARAATAAGGDPLLVLGQAVATECAGQLPEALALYRKVFEATKDPQAGNNAAFITSQLHPKDTAKLTEALGWANVAVEAKPDDATFRDTRGWILLLLGKMAEARRDIRHAIKGRPGSPEIHYHVGVIEAKAGRRDLSRWHFEAAASSVVRIKAAEGRLTVSAEKAAALARQALAQIGQGGN